MNRFLNNMSRCVSALAVGAILFSALMASCGSDECYDNRNSLPLAALYSAGSSPQAISIDSISVWGIGVPNDSLVLNCARNVKQIYFPFRIDESETSFVIRYDALKAAYPLAPNDTITFTYQNVPVFESEACGVSYQFRDVQIRHTTFFIDSIACPSGFIDNKPATNLSIYFRTQSSD